MASASLVYLLTYNKYIYLYVLCTYYILCKFELIAGLANVLISYIYEKFDFRGMTFAVCRATIYGEGENAHANTCARIDYTHIAATTAVVTCTRWRRVCKSP